MSESVPNLKSRNDELYESAIASYREVIPAWRAQWEAFIGHPGEFDIDFSGCAGRYEYLSSFIQHALAGTLEGMAQLAFDPQWRPDFAAYRKLTIAAKLNDPTIDIRTDGDAMTVTVPLLTADQRPSSLIADALKAHLGGARSACGVAVDPAILAPRVAPLSVDAPADDSDPYALAQRFITQLEQLLREKDLWPKTPPPEPLVVKGAFGSENMAYEQWLAWVLIPRVRKIIADRGAFPKSSSLGAYAVRAFDGMGDRDELVALLSDFDQFIDNLEQT